VARPSKYLLACPPKGKMSLAQVCDFLGVCRQTIYNYGKVGDFPTSVKLHGFVWFDTSEIEEWKRTHSKA
jgi:predicted DNA-binding transcriptional regulator AlpA